MSSITSSAYPVVTTSLDGDLFAVVRNGQLVKMNRAALTAYIQTLAPNTFLALTDAPGSFVGQAGKVPAVNVAEDALEFVSGAANFFVSLTDGPGSYGGQAGNSVRVNGAETALEYYTSTFIGLPDTPASFAGASEYIARVNTAANAIEFVTPTAAAPTANLTGGWFDIEHAGANQAYTSGSGYVTLENDGAGANSRSDYAPPGVTSIYDSANDQFDFSELSVGDVVVLRIVMDVTTTAANQSTTTRLEFDNNGSQFYLPLGYSEFKTAAAHPVIREITFYIGSNDVKNNPVEIQFTSDNNATVNMTGYSVYITRRGA